MKPQPQMVADKTCKPWGGDPNVLMKLMADIGRKCQHGQPGDRLWVRETWMPDAPCDGTWAHTEFYGCKGAPLNMIPERFQKPEHCLFRSTWDGNELVGWKPSIHMPRWASRIDLEIAGVRVERLNDISEADALTEGSAPTLNEIDSTRLGAIGTYKEGFRQIWEKINGTGSWNANPWVWVLEFKKLATTSLEDEVMR